MKATAQKLYRHIRSVQDAMDHIINDLTFRARTHDASKFQDDEIEGYARFEVMPQGLTYGSPEHIAIKAAILTDNDCFKNHAARNDHHPEHYADVQKMPFTAIQEMVCDWAGAHLEFGNTGSWPQSVVDNIAKHNFSEGQIWLIYQVANFLMSNIGVLQEGRTEDCPKLKWIQKFESDPKRIIATAADAEPLKPSENDMLLVDDPGAPNERNEQEG